MPCEPKWSDWFFSYNQFILHYANIAEETGCEMLCIGCEMVMSDRRDLEWRNLIAEVRKVYSGIITYNCDKYQENNVKWWDAVDVISSSGYYPINDWETQLDRNQTVLSASDKREWIKGFMLWDWPAKLYEPQEAARNDDYCMYQKQAEIVVRLYYSSKRELKGRSSLSVKQTVL